MTGKDKCRILKEIRREIAQKNDIEWVVKECTHQGECRGTCPRCESEVRKLERELELRRKIGKAVAVVGISTACLAGLTACHSGKPSPDDIAGMIDVIESTQDPNGDPYEHIDPNGDPYEHIDPNGDPYQGIDPNGNPYPQGNDPYQLDGDVAIIDGEVPNDYGVEEWN